MKMLSIPANPGTPSFLDLPAEIRNWIYEFLFCHSDPLYLSETGNKSITLLERWIDRNDDLERYVPRVPHNDLPAPRWCATVSCLAHVSQPGLQLLRVCHQVHREAASILYANDFYIAPKYDTHPTYHDTTGLYMNRTTESWLRQIGQHRFFVRKLVIDLGSICYLNRKPRAWNNSQTFRTRDGFLHFGALLDAVWASDQRMAVTLIDSKPHLSCRMPLDPQQNNSVYILNYSNTLILEPRNVKKLNAVFYSFPGHIDLDSSSDFKESNGIFYSNKTFHDKYLDIFLRGTFELSMMSTDAYAILDFNKLERLLQTKFKCRCSTTAERIELHFGSEIQYSISIHVYSSTPLLKDIRINIMSLVTATFSADASRPVQIRLHNGDTRIKTQTTSIRKLRQITLKALTKYVKIEHRNNFRVKCPEIWINGHGEIANIVSTVPLSYSGCKDPAKMNRTLWSAEETGYVGAKPNFRVVPNGSGLARKVYLWLKWIVSVDDWENSAGTEDQMGG
jgi:hypothetical protein